MDIIKKLEIECTRNKNAKYTLNMTCGTKIMSLGAYLFCDGISKDKDIDIYYMSIGKNYFQSINSHKRVESFSLSIKEYLSSYGIKFNSKNYLKTHEYCNQFLQFYLSSNFNINAIGQLRKNYRGQKRISILNVENANEKEKKIEHLSNVLQELKFQNEEENILTKKEVDFLTGGWFEEYIYHSIKAYYSFDDNSILLGVNLMKSNTSNENDLDIVVIRDNRLIVIECKTSMKINGALPT
jgi:hypothetical protein